MCSQLLVSHRFVKTLMMWGSVQPNVWLFQTTTRHAVSIYKQTIYVDNRQMLMKQVQRGVTSAASRPVGRPLVWSRHALVAYTINKRTAPRAICLFQAQITRRWKAFFNVFRPELISEQRSAVQTALRLVVYHSCHMQRRRCLRSSDTAANC